MHFLEEPKMTRLSNSRTYKAARLSRLFLLSHIGCADPSPSKAVVIHHYLYVEEPTDVSTLSAIRQSDYDRLVQAGGPQMKDALSALNIPILEQVLPSSAANVGIAEIS